ncbi:uncharacterized protein CLUP02_05325 [Colletotrichum lupini]|uniref:Uncharacterized protein n=1 Tax=Colletotrichum lupini TaxID=145971 RepID=A0A9Q8SMD9_9PEZI|nr:uncharacterized protein CLUP02_05325 [Colletotrichum lupini]UQC79845.1 hypothetical protein CLUP02_05325 [Colletotrichum lupini]
MFPDFDIPSIIQVRYSKHLRFPSSIPGTFHFMRTISQSVKEVSTCASNPMAPNGSMGAAPTPSRYPAAGISSVHLRQIYRFGTTNRGPPTEGRLVQTHSDSTQRRLACGYTRTWKLNIVRHVDTHAQAAYPPFIKDERENKARLRNWPKVKVGMNRRVTSYNGDFFQPKNQLMQVTIFNTALV